MNETLNRAVQKLAHARKTEAAYKQKVADIEAELLASPLGQLLEDYRERLGAARADVADAETVVRTIALETFGATGNKQPHPAVKVVMYAVLDYDSSDAIRYCREHLPQALRLDKRVFEKAAKVIDLDFVTVNKMPTARISTDLSAYLQA